MQQKTKSIYIALYLSLFLSFVMILFRITALLFYIEPNTGLYLYGTDIGLFFNISLFISFILIFISCIPLYKYPTEENISYSSSLFVFSSSFTGFMFISVFLTKAVFYFVNKSISSINLVLLLFSLLSAAFFLLDCSRKKKTDSQNKFCPRSKRFFLSLSPIIYYSVRLVSLFLDTSSAMNSSERSLTLLMMCIFLLFFLGEARAILPNSEKKQRKSQNLFSIYFFSLSCFFIVFLFAIPQTILSAFWIIDTKTPFAESVLDISIGIYALVQIIESVKKFSQKNVSKDIL